MEFTKLDDRIYFIEGLNRGRYFYSNSLFIEDGKNLLIDTGTGLNEKIAKEKAIDIILISHGHEDHICGNSFYDNSLICSHSLDAPAVRSVDKLTELYNVVGTPVEEPMDNFLRMDIVTQKPLFSSTHKYDSGTGWPSFWRTIDDDSVTLHEDNSLSTTRTEVRSDAGHVGHVFEDGPIEEGGRRFCTNSASLLFIAKEEMKEKGYEEYLNLFE